MKKGKWKSDRRHYIDPLIVNRVKKFLADNVDKQYVDVGQMVRTLRERYREYASIQQTTFYRNVETAYNVVLQSYGLNGPETSLSSSSSDGDSDVTEIQNQNDGLNDCLTKMYSQKRKNSKEYGEEIDKNSELIDISSDDDFGNETVPQSLKFNNQITIKPTQSESEMLPVTAKLKKIDTTSALNVTTDSVQAVTEEITKKRKIPRKVIQIPVKTIGDPKLKYSSKYSFQDVGGIDHIMEQICDLIIHMKHPEVYSKLGIKAPRGALLHGPPGTGKTIIAHAIAERLRLPILAIVATELVGGMSGESEKLIRETFKLANDLAPCVLFIDEIDSICGNRLNAQKDMEKRMVAQLLNSIDNLNDKDAQVLLLAATNNPDSLDPGLRRAGRLEQEIPLGIPTLGSRKDILQVLSRKLNLDPNIDMNLIAQLTPGFVGADLQALINKSCTVAVKRIFKHYKENSASTTNNDADDNKPVVITENGEIPVPEKSVNGESSEHLEVLDSEKKLSESNDPNSNDNKKTSSETSTALTDKEVIDNPVLINNTNDSVCVVENSVPLVVDDLQNYIDDSYLFTPEQLSEMKIIQEDIVIALKTTKPCAIREGIITVPDTTWEDIGSLVDVRRDLQLAVLAPVKYPDQLKSLGLTVPSGVLLCGPPGCGKTLLAKAVANEAGINFISVKGPELLNMYVGESERAVRTCFSRARNSAPCVIFFDEFDSLCPKRTNNDISGATRVVNQLLTEMDGIEGREGVFILAATNRPDIIDPAVLRPGRLDKIIFVGMPLYDDRIDILRAITKKGTKPPLSSDVDLEAIAKATQSYTGADLAGLVRQAATEALTDFITGNLTNGQLVVTANHFQIALGKLRPSVSLKELNHYEKLRLKYSSQRDDKVDMEMDTLESMDTV